MKKIIASLVILAFGTVLLGPLPGYAGSPGPGPGGHYTNPVPHGPSHPGPFKGWGPGPYYPRYWGYSDCCYDDLAVAGGIALGAILLGTIVGSLVTQPRTGSTGTVPGSPAYAYPDPALSPDPGDTTGTPPGEWVRVPGQWVGDQWVPPHDAWVPVNP